MRQTGGRSNAPFFFGGREAVGTIIYRFIAK
jgi:hypothetical protein